jgi:hypothetical protein
MPAPGKFDTSYISDVFLTLFIFFRYGRLAHLRHVPWAILLERSWTSDLPGSWPEYGNFLRDNCGGYNWPIIGKLQSNRVAFALTAMLRENLNPETSLIGLEIKATIGTIFGETIHCPAISEIMTQLDFKTDQQLELAKQFAEKSVDLNKFNSDPKIQALLQLAKQISPSPVQVDEALIKQLKAADCLPGEIVEVVSWIAVLQCIYRMKNFYPDEE